MGYGLIGTGRGKLDRATHGLEVASQMEERRNTANDALKTAARVQKKQMAATGAGVGAMVGGSSAAMGATYGAWAGPVGVAAGAVAGLVLNELF